MQLVSEIKRRFLFEKLGYKGRFIYNSEREREGETGACTWQGATRFDKRAAEYHQFERETKLGRGCACVRAKNLPLKSTPAATRRPRDDDNGRRVEKCP